MGKKGPATLDQSLLIKVSLVLSHGSCSPPPPLSLAPSLPPRQAGAGRFQASISSGELAMSGTRFHMSLCFLIHKLMTHEPAEKALTST